MTGKNIFFARFDILTVLRGVTSRNLADKHRRSGVTYWLGLK
jgi:hypothetical protein